MTQATETNKRIGLNIRQRRNQRPWTQEVLADAAQVEVRTVQRAEKGVRISAESLQAIAGALDVSVEDLRSAPGESKKEQQNVAERYKVVHLVLIERASAFRHLMTNDALSLDYVDDITDGAQELEIAGLEQLLRDCLDGWKDLEPMQRPEALQPIQHQLDKLKEFGMIVAAGTEKMQLRSASDEKPFSMDVLHILVSKSTEPKLFLVHERNREVCLS